jgi:hypothetical protein
MQIRDGLYYNERFDPERNPRTDIAAAGALARESGKRILMELGGDWCVWCTIMDTYFIEHRDVRTAFRESFVIVKVNFSRENQNAAFLANFRGLRVTRFIMFWSAMATFSLTRTRRFSSKARATIARGCSHSRGAGGPMGGQNRMQYLFGCAGSRCA